MIRFLNKGGSGTNTSDATATADDILSPKTAYVNNKKIKGTILPTYISVNASTYAKNDLEQTISPSKWWSIPLGNYIFYIYTNGNNMYIVAINNSGEIEATTSYSLSTLFDNTKIADVLLTWDSYDTNTYTICVGKGFNNGKGLTEARFRRLKYSVLSKDFTLIDGIAIGQWGDNDNDYGWGGRGCYTYPNTVIIQYSSYSNLSFAYAQINWTESSGSVKNIATRYRTATSNWGIYETGNGHIFTSPYKLYVLNDSKTAVTDVTTDSTAYISHNCRYMIYKKTLYSVNKNEDANKFFNSKIIIQADLPSYSQIQFAEDDSFALLVNSTNIYVIQFNDTGWKLYQTLSISNTSAPFNGNYILGLFSSSLNLFRFTSGKMLKTLDIQGNKYVKLLPNETPSNSDKILIGEKYLSISGDILNGTMPNNGNLTYTPTDEEQIIPEGYTSGGKVSAIDITTLDEYKECLLLSANILSGSLPYEKLEYIESTGTQYISTEITMNKTDSVKMILDINISNDGYCGVNGYLQFQMPSEYRNTRCTVKVEYNGSTNDETVYMNDILELTKNWSSYNANYSLIGLFNLGMENNSWSTDSSHIQIGILYGCKLYKNDKLIRDFIPVKKKSDNTICLFDLVTNTFFTNEGTGDFIGGEIVNE